MQTETNIQRSGEPVTSKVRDRKYTAEAKAALTPDIWKGAGSVMGEMEDGAEVAIYAMPTIAKVAEYGDKRWAWLHLANGVTIKVYEGSNRAAALGLQFDAGKHRPAAIANDVVVVTGKLRQTESGWTMANPWIVRPEDRTETQADLAAQTQAAFDTAHDAALAGLQVFEESEAEDGLDD